MNPDTVEIVRHGFVWRLRLVYPQGDPILCSDDYPDTDKAWADAQELWPGVVIRIINGQEG